MGAAPEQLDLFADAEPDFDAFDAEVFEGDFSDTFPLEAGEWSGAIRRHVAYGWLASEADVAATHIIQIVTAARVGRADPQEPVAAYLGDILTKAVEHHGHHE
jgi:hypothetical protein